MTDEQTPSQEGQGEDSPVIKDLRRMLKNEKQARKDLEARLETAETDVRAKIQRENTVSSALDELGLPAKLADKLELPEGDIDRDIIAESVQEQFGLDPAALAQPSSEPTQEPTPQPTQQENDLQRVSDLSSRVRALADGGVDPSTALQKKIDAASSQEELNQIMAEAGLTANLTSG